MVTAIYANDKLTFVDPSYPLEFRDVSGWSLLEIYERAYKNGARVLIHGDEIKYAEPIYRVVKRQREDDYNPNDLYSTYGKTMIGILDYDNRILSIFPSNRSWVKTTSTVSDDDSLIGAADALLDKLKNLDELVIVKEGESKRLFRNAKVKTFYNIFGEE